MRKQIRIKAENQLKNNRNIRDWEDKRDKKRVEELHNCLLDFLPAAGEIAQLLSWIEKMKESKAEKYR